MTHFWSLKTDPIFQNPPTGSIKSENPEIQWFSLKIVSKTGKNHPQKSWKIRSSTQNPKILNHVFKSSKKTLSPSRTYCKIYKIENIGKIGQSSVGLKAKRVIYYGSTRSTLSTPLREKYPPLFSGVLFKNGSDPKLSLLGLFGPFLAKMPLFDTFWPTFRFDRQLSHVAATSWN